MDENSRRIKMQIGEIIRKAREDRKGYSQKELSSLTNISLLNIRRIEEGKQLPGLVEFIILSKKLNIDVDKSLHLLNDFINKDT